MFKYFKNIKNLNRIWQILNDRYFNELNGKISNTVIKIEEDVLKGNYLKVKTDNESVKNILISQESKILDDINNITGISFNKIHFAD